MSLINKTNEYALLKFSLYFFYQFDGIQLECFAISNKFKNIQATFSRFHFADERMDNTHFFTQCALRVAEFQPPIKKAFS